jgi:hypothetical protein
VCPPSGPMRTFVAKTPGNIGKAPRLVRSVDGEKYTLLRSNLVKDSVGPLPDSVNWVDDSIHIVLPSDGTTEMNEHLAKGTSLIFPPGVYDLDDTLRVTQPYTCIVGLGYATLRSTVGKTAILVADGAEGVCISALIIDAGDRDADGKPADSILQVGETVNGGGNTQNPTILSDIFLRVGGPTLTATASIMLLIKQRGVIVHHAWAWSADHTATINSGVGVNNAVCQVGVQIEGDDVIALGLFVEHTLKELVLWKGNRGHLEFMQSELRYDVGPDWDYPGLRVTGTEFEGIGIGVYSFFANKWGKDYNPPRASPNPTSAIVVPSDASITSAFTRFLSANYGAGSIQHVINGKGPKTDASSMGPVWCGFSASKVIMETCPEC